MVAVPNVANTGTVTEYPDVANVPEPRNSPFAAEAMENASANVSVPVTQSMLVCLGHDFPALAKVELPLPS